MKHEDLVNENDDMFRVLQIKCRLHKSQVRERDVRVSIKQLFQRGRDDKKVFCPDK